MLSVEECKKYLHGGNYTDEQVEHIRQSLYQLAGLFITEYIKDKKAGKIMAGSPTKAFGDDSGKI